eukprot:scaffold6650_cov110-Isochrysis_galbana.AAC.4
MRKGIIDDRYMQLTTKIGTVSKIDPKTINTLEKVRSFLGLCSYYRKFIRRFAVKADPLTHLTTRNGCDVETETESQTTDECQAAIEALKTAMTSEQVLMPPRDDRPFIVKTDGVSTLGIGGVLTQKDHDRRERVVAY